ncbi:MAG: PASTA domain-containing protein [Pyrinomonadaceae bacterium]
MSFVNSGISAIGRLIAVGLLGLAFLFGMAGVVYMSLQGEQVQVPEILGKDVPESEKELALLGLQIKKRADRFSNETPGTIVEQLPKAGETVKTGQTIRVVVSKGPGEGDQPDSLKNTNEEDDSAKIEEMISDKPKKSKATNSNRKKADTARDVNAVESNSDPKSDPPESNSNKKDKGTSNNSSEKTNKNTQTPPMTRLPNPASNKPVTKPTIRP